MYMCVISQLLTWASAYCPPGAVACGGRPRDADADAEGQSYRQITTNQQVMRSATVPLGVFASAVRGLAWRGTRLPGRERGCN